MQATYSYRVISYRQGYLRPFAYSCLALLLCRNLNQIDLAQTDKTRYYEVRL